jgi:hypothetical protein
VIHPPRNGEKRPLDRLTEVYPLVVLLLGLVPELAKELIGYLIPTLNYEAVNMRVVLDALVPLP